MVIKVIFLEENSVRRNKKLLQTKEIESIVKEVPRGLRNSKSPET
jgi:hypothetical protein